MAISSQRGDEAAAVKPLPIGALGAEAATTRGLRRAGLVTIGDVASRARHEIAARFGSDFIAMLEEALGERDAPISPRKPLPDYIVEKRFPEPVATDGVIAATLASLGKTLVAAMERGGKGARRLEASFFRTDGAMRTLVVETGQAVTRSEVIDRLFRERLDSLADPLDPGFGFDLIRLSASHTADFVQKQRDLDATVHDNDELAALIDRISARVGARAGDGASAGGLAYSRAGGARRQRPASTGGGNAGGLAGAHARRSRRCGRCGCSPGPSRSM